MVLDGSLRGLALALRGGTTFWPALLIGCTVDVVKSWPATWTWIRYTSGVLVSHAYFAVTPSPGQSWCLKAGPSWTKSWLSRPGGLAQRSTSALGTGRMAGGMVSGALNGLGVRGLVGNASM